MFEGPIEWASLPTRLRQRALTTHKFATSQGFSREEATRIAEHTIRTHYDEYVAQDAQLAAMAAQLEAQRQADIAAAEAKRQARRVGEVEQTVSDVAKDVAEKGGKVYGAGTEYV